MNQDDKDILKVIATVAIVGVVGIILLITPILYFEGKVKSQYLKTQRQIEMPWYQSAFLPDTVFMDIKIVEMDIKVEKTIE